MQRWTSVLPCVLAMLFACKSGGDATPDASSANDGRAPDGASNDSTPPTFGGIMTATAIGETTALIGWSAAQDQVTPVGRIVYRVYQSTSPGGETFTSAPVSTVTGVEGATIENLAAGVKYYFVVRAVDEAGNADTNTIERSTLTPDTKAPAFAGAETASAGGAGELNVTWNPASDEVSPPAAIKYRVYAATTPGGESFGSPALTTAMGATSAKLTGLGSLHTAYVVVRAVDAAGNEDTNVREQTATTADSAAPVFAGAGSATGGDQAVTLAWPTATDDGTASSQLVYQIYVATAAGGESYATPSYVSAAGASGITITDLAVSTTYYFVVRAKDGAGNVDTNTIEVSATTSGNDVMAPAFGGLATATAKTPSSILLSWTAATDNVTATNQLRYVVYRATTAGGEDFSTPLLTTTPGATSATITGLAPQGTYYFVVRAKDGAGNVDMNVTERSATTPATTISFATQIQPIFTASCALSACHAGATPQMGMDLSAGNAYANIVNIASGECTSVHRIEPYASAQSYLMWKIQGSGPCFTGSQMPKMGMPVSQADRTKIATWIDEGALDN
jgi:hypothetical protein